jgi:hypothetical protein
VAWRVAINISYFVHDLDDPAVSRRVRMLSVGGGTAKLVGFHRSAKPIASVDGVQAVDLGRTEPAKLLWRTLSVAKVAINLNAAGDALRDADVIIARNLEMLLLAVRARNHFAPGSPVIYECLDIHRLLLSASPVGHVLRLLEDSLWRQTDLLLTSSPAFIRNYFAPRKFPSAVQLVENKVLHLEHEADSHELKRPAPGEPWRIGWFGVLRCRKSFDMLSRLTRELPGRVEVVLRGRPAPSIFPDFESEVARTPGMSFGGPYRNPADLGAIYGDVHFAWALDYFEESQNSAWLLPNRIYEGCLWGAVPLALGEVETGNWLAKRGAGVLLPDPPYEALLRFFRSLDADHYQKLAASVLRIPRSDLVDDAEGCRALVEALPAKRTGPATTQTVRKTVFTKPLPDRRGSNAA